MCCITAHRFRELYLANTYTGLARAHLHLHSFDENLNDLLQPDAGSESLVGRMVMMMHSLQEVAVELLKAEMHLLGCCEHLDGLEW